MHFRQRVAEVRLCNLWELLVVVNIVTKLNVKLFITVLPNKTLIDR